MPYKDVFHSSLTGRRCSCTTLTTRPEYCLQRCSSAKSLHHDNREDQIVSQDCSMLYIPEKYAFSKQQRGLYFSGKRSLFLTFCPTPYSRKKIVYSTFTSQFLYIGQSLGFYIKIFPAFHNVCYPLNFQLKCQCK